MVQVPVPLVILMVAVPMPPLVIVQMPLQADATVMETARPELAVAATWKVELNAALVGALVITEIV
jgi:hypothetical protein